MIKALWLKGLAHSKWSATHLWANIVIWASALTELAIVAIDPICDLLDDPDVKAQIGGYLPPKWVPVLMISIMIVTKLARNRTLRP